MTPLTVLMGVVWLGDSIGPLPKWRLWSTDWSMLPYFNDFQIKTHACQEKEEILNIFRGETATVLWWYWDMEGTDETGHNTETWRTLMREDTILRHEGHWWDRRQYWDMKDIGETGHRWHRTKNWDLHLPFLIHFFYISRLHQYPWPTLSVQWHYFHKSQWS